MNREPCQWSIPVGCDGKQVTMIYLTTPRNMTAAEWKQMERVLHHFRKGIVLDDQPASREGGGEGAA